MSSPAISTHKLVTECRGVMTNAPVDLVIYRDILCTKIKPAETNNDIVITWKQGLKHGNVKTTTKYKQKLSFFLKSLEQISNDLNVVELYSEWNIDKQHIINYEQAFLQPPTPSTRDDNKSTMVCYKYLWMMTLKCKRTSFSEDFQNYKSKWQPKRLKWNLFI